MCNVTVRVGRSTDGSAAPARDFVSECWTGRAGERLLWGAETARLTPERAGDSGGGEEPRWGGWGRSCRPSSLAHIGVIGSQS